SAWQKSGTNQQRPEIFDIVVRLVIVHLVFRTESEAECRKLEKSFSSPRRHVEETNTVGPHDSEAVLQRSQRIPQMLENGDAQDDIKAGGRYLRKCVRQRPFDRSDICAAS